MMTLRLLAFHAFLLLSVALDALAAPTVADLRALAAGGNHEQVVVAADATIAALPPNLRMAAWRIDYKSMLATRTLLGARRAYVTYNVSTRWNGPNPPSLFVPDKRPVIRHDAQGYDEATVVVCVDADSGTPLWSRRFQGIRNFVMDPKTDDLWASSPKLFRLDANSGEVTLEKNVGPGTREITGLRIQGEVVAWRYQNGVHPSSTLVVYDVDTGRVEQLPHRPALLSPNRLRVLRRTVSQSPQDVTSTVALTTLDGRTVDWTFRTPGYSENDPVWFKRDVLVLSGTERTRGAVSRLDGGTGQLQWTYVLPRGALGPSQIQLAHGGYTEYSWDAVGELAGHVAALGGGGELAVLDARTGEPLALSRIVPNHLAFPRLVDKHVVIAGTTALLAVPLDVLLDSAAESERDALLLKGRSLLTLGRAEEAQSVAQSLTTNAPEFAAGWQFAADAARAAGKQADETIARVRAMQAAGMERSPELLASHGLLARIDTGAISADLISVGPVVYAGSRDGTLLKIDAHSLQVIERRSFTADISSLRLRGNSLYRWGEDRHEELIASFFNVSAEEDAQQGGQPVFDKSNPREWNTVNGYDGAVVRHDGKLYLPSHGGDVRVLENNEVTRYATPLPDIEQWNIHLGPGGPLGYGTGGVYKLDENLCPVEKLIDAGRDRNNRHPYLVPLLASDGKTIAIFVRRLEQPVLQIWTADGKHKLREEPAVSSGGYVEREKLRLIHLRDGYFFSGNELVWVPTNVERPVWRFNLQPLPRSPARHQWKHDYSFTPPRVADDHLFVACHEGGVFVFSVAKLTTPATRLRPSTRDSRAGTGSVSSTAPARQE